MKKWEYMIVSGDILNQNMLNEFGNKGWELCEIIKCADYPKLSDYYFKRELVESTVEGGK